MAVNDTPIVPVYEPDREFRTFLRSEVYDGIGEGVWVPNVDDLVIDYATGFWRCVEVDPTTGLSKLIPWTLPKDPGELTNEDVLLGTGPGYQSETYRAYLDTSVIPHTLALDSRLHVYGTTLTSCKVFLGTDTGDESNVISAFYDQGGTLLGENIPLELVAMPDRTNLAVKAPMVGYTNTKLSDGEPVTAVFYDDVGVARSIAKLLIKNTAFIRTTDASRKFITSIHLESPFLSDADDRLLQYPINMPVSALPLVGVVSYSDGSVNRLPVDGSKFRMHGLQHYVATIEGQKIPLVLTYYLSEGEYNYGAQPGATKHLSEKYSATTLALDEAYAIKLFGYPTWIDDVNGYRMEFYLYNLNRQRVYRVTPYVKLGANSASFDPLNFTSTQYLTYTVDMNKVDSSYPAYRHVQTMAVSLLAPGNEDTTNWVMGFSPNQNPLYGTGLAARVTFVDVDNWKLDLSNGFNSKEEWLNHLYYPAEPLYNPDTEVQAPKPNYFVLVDGARRTEYHIDQWNQELTISLATAEGGTMFIEWIYRHLGGDLQLGVSGLSVHQVIV